MNRFVGLGAVLVVAFCVLQATALAAEPESPEARLEKSLKTWQKLKEECGGNYSYMIRVRSFIGSGSDTTIVIRDNKIAERKFREWGPPPQNPVPVQPGSGPKAETPAGETWSEKGEDIGSHKQGAPAKTLDELYAAAAKVVKVWSGKRSEFEELMVEFDEQGLLKSCFTRDTRIADDAPRNGVIIDELKLGDAKSKVYKAPNGKPFPTHWGAPPRLQTRDLRPLPGGYGQGSGTLARWIQQNLDRDAKNEEK
ncbi:hypothetical protein GC197_03110 [bacterium]|nr:hypothetical protein [bacterium]